MLAEHRVAQTPIGDPEDPDWDDEDSDDEDEEDDDEEEPLQLRRCTDDVAGAVRRRRYLAVHHC